MAPKQDPKPKFQEGLYRETTRQLAPEGGGFVVVVVDAAS